MAIKVSKEKEVSGILNFKEASLPLISGTGLFRQTKITDGHHTYDYDVDISSDTAASYVICMVGQGKRVLELGCGPGSITKVLSKEGGCQVTGLELDPNAIKLVRPYCLELIEADLNSQDWPKLLDTVEKFDVVVAADVLEHLHDPWKTLKQMSMFINTNGYIVVSMPNVGHAAVISCLINSDFEYRDWGLLDSTHIRFFGLKNIEDLFTRAKLKIIEANYVRKHPEKTEFIESWLKIPFATQQVLMGGEHAEIYQVVIKAVPLDFPGQAVQLISSNNSQQHTFPQRNVSLKYRIAQRLSQQTKQRIRKVFLLMGVNL